MKKFIITFLILLISSAGFCAEFDYQKTYREMEPADFSYVHNIDPDQYYDCKNYSWTPYPLLRLNSPVYFKNIVIEPGYYNLTPRENKGKLYMLFKESGLVRYIIPIYKKDFVSEYFYEENLPQPKLTTGQKIMEGIYTFVGKHFKSAKRTPAPKSFLEITDLDNNFVSIVVYYKEFKYYMILRTTRL